MNLITKLYNGIINILLIILMMVSVVMTFTLEPNGSDEHFIAFLGVKIGCFIIMMVAYYGIRIRGILDKLSV